MPQMVNFIPETFFDTTLSAEERVPTCVCSVYPARAYITHSESIITVPECRDSMRCAVSTPVGPGTERKDYGNAQILVLESISARDNALDAIGLTRERTNSRGEKITGRTTSEWWESGYFVPMKAGEPSDEEIAAARTRLNEWARRWVMKGDDNFAKDQNPAHIDFRSKLAARVLRVRKHWSEGITDVVQKSLCPSCRNEINQGATKCPACGDRFTYVDGKPVADVAPIRDPGMPTTAPPQKQGAR